MSIVKCKECGKEISELANKCPHCGRENPNLSIETIGIIYLVSILIVGYVFFKIYSFFFL